MGNSILVTGAVRSGKSEWAEHLALQSGKPVTYIATAKEDPSDPEWTARIQHHRDRRPDTWQFIAEAKDLSGALKTIPSGHCVLVDSLGLWVAAHLETEAAQWHELMAEFLELLPTLDFLSIMVAEETGWGLVPTYPMGRLFRDRLGRLIRQTGLKADETYLLAGGHALNLKQLGQPLPEAQSPLF
ncbi:adenosylcobinamide kinase [[Leptolyngbya] sp. PCC 7376]|uniref:bifunctional adenosylcobinamide kinase/adenosylcobinamide-phosphate guanylyltransferase n=1 Tax=[Leptolyngbya] sp. PCC 7376 TaxID=111781 RepID=UPI00029F06FA|nr:bifunctional adenosylcobinamide kinase/adenosylcobinamide-phosphate guanylyltransferase [[Leptolyngbya] sp. PCC 7376]AFY40451.1 adenosylcobinamide kinase [[Leptolyngbya] sp. PCC 7376]